MKKSKKIILIILVSLISIYIIYAIYLLITNPVDTYVIKKGTLAQEEPGIGYIIRNEKVIKGENYENGIYSIVSEGQKVGNGDSIFRYYSDSEKEITQKLNELNYKIQELLEKEENNTPSADIKSIENQIEDKLVNTRILNNIQEINDYKDSIDSLISKKIDFIGDVTTNSEIKQLVAQKKEYEKQLKNGAEYKKAEMSGIVSYRVDGLEEELTEENFNNLTEEYLDNLDLKTGQIVATSNECGKIIDNFNCYIAVTTDSEEGMSSEVGDSVQIRISDKEKVDAEIAQINEESGKRTIIFKLNQMTENLINHRKIAIDIIWWDESGLKVPNQALIEENGLYYVLRNRAGVQSKILVKVTFKTDKFSIIESYQTEELQELGIDEDEIKNYKKINNYDEIMLQ